jgi:hypothetical protein
MARPQYIPHTRRQQISLLRVVLQKFPYRASSSPQYKARVNPSSHTDSSARFVRQRVFWGWYPERSEGPQLKPHASFFNVALALMPALIPWQLTPLLSGVRLLLFLCRYPI